MKPTKGEVHINRQPTETSCGPTCLHALYSYYGRDVSIESIMDEVDWLPTGGTLAVHLGIHALREGFRAKIYSYNIMLFDPTWFRPERLSSKELIAKLEQQRDAKKADARFRSAIDAYIQFITDGGEVMMEDLSPDLLRRYLQKKTPLLTGLSSTYLYQAPREFVAEGRQWADDVHGTPEGHFVIIEKYNHRTRHVTIADPFATNPYSPNLRYTVSLSRLVTAILLGVLTYDANFLVVEPI
ncbi:MAG: hypothetical protein KDK78_09465 [Chlamydiia bacterium]|nr:hypothetical protein [Chlamydiia bacterium]